MNSTTMSGLHNYYYQTIETPRLMHCVGLIINIRSFPLLRHYCLSIGRTQESGASYAIQADTEIDDLCNLTPKKCVEKDTSRQPKCFWEGTGVCACAVCNPQSTKLN